MLAVLFVVGVEFGYCQPELAGVVHLEEVAVFVDDYILLDVERQLGEVDVEI